MTVRMKEIEALLKAIEKLKATMCLVEVDKSMPFEEQTRKLSALRQDLRRMGWYTLELMQLEYDENRNPHKSDDDGSGEEHG